MVASTNHVIAPGPWHFGTFLNIFLLNLVNTKKGLPSERGAPGSVPYYGKSGLIIALRSKKD